MITKIKFDLLYVIIVSTIVLVMTDVYHELLPDISLTIPSFLGTSISILLSFKLSQSYDRWWEARKIWGSIVNDSRSFVIQLRSFVAQGNENMVVHLAHRQIAWCYCLGQSLRGLDPMKNMDQFISARDIEILNKQSNKPLALMDLHAENIKELREKEQMDVFSQVQLDKTLIRLVESQGRAERIKSTVFPVTYRIFLHGIIYLFVIILAVSLKEMHIYFELPIITLISSAFFLLEKTATYLQDPFENKPTDTAMTAIARTIEINIRQLLNEKDIPSPIKAEKFYLL